MVKTMLNTSEYKEKASICTNQLLSHKEALNPAIISVRMKQWGITPYIYIRQALKQLSDGDYKESFRIIEYAGEFAGIYYPENSIQNNDYKQTITLLRYLVLHLADEFGLIEPLEDKNGD